MSSPTAPAADARRARNATPIAVVVVGGLSIVLLLATHRVSERQTAQDLAAERRVHDLETAVAYWHLWLEEFLTNEEDVDLAVDVRGNQRIAMDLVELLLTGGVIEGGVVVEPLQEPRLRREVEALAAALDAFSRLTEARLEDPATAGVGSQLDHAFDLAFRQVKTHTDALKRLESVRVESNQARFRLLVWLIVAVWLLIVAAAAAGLRSRERRRREVEQALRQREAELLQAQKMEAVGRLAGGIAHDVNNYLGAIRGYCEVAMLNGESGAALDRRMGAAIETADKMSALIRQLLAFSRRQPVQPEAVDLGRVVTDTELLMRQLLGEDIEFETRLGEALRSIEIDPSQIEQTLVNLLVNARDAMPEGGKIVVETANVELDEAAASRDPAARPGAYVRLSVADTGNGIPLAVRGQIFEPFFTTKAARGSSGLGLATVYAIVQQAGGFLTVWSEIGNGTRFEIFLPASDSPAAPPVAPRARATASTGPARVLLVEDNEEMRIATSELLEALGHHVQVAADGEEALAVLNGDETFDLIVTDVIMPGLSGKQLVERIRERHGDVRCLFISGYTDNVMLRHGFDQERVHFLQKPFGFDDLARKVAEILS